jgi:hypothetical protein
VSTPDGNLAALLAAGYQLTYAQAPGTGAWFADLRDRDGRCAEVGCGPTKEMALELLAERLGRDENRITVLIASAERGETGTARSGSADEMSTAREHSAEYRKTYRGDGSLPGAVASLADQVQALAGRMLAVEAAGYDNLLAVLGEGSLVTFIRDAEDGSYFADVTTEKGAMLHGTGESPAAALQDAKDSEEYPEPYCITCGEPVSIFIGYEGWRHYRGEGTPENRTELYDAGHAPVVAWRWPGES